MNEEIKTNQLPKTWLQRTLGDVVTKRTVKATPQQFPDVKFIGMDCIEPHSMRPSFLYDFKEFKSSGNLFEENEVLYGRMRPYLNKVYRAEFGGACSGEFIVLKCKDDFAPNYLKYILHAKSFVRFANEKTSGDRPRISFDEISEYPVLVPPIGYQALIVSKIEELFSEIDKGIEEINTAQQQLKVYRQAVLKSAFEGLKEEKILEEITSEYLIGIVRSNSQQNEKGIGVRYIKMNNVNLDGHVDFKKVVYVEVTESEAKKYSLAKGDILINTRNSIELVGKSGVVREDTKAVFNNNLLRIRTKKEFHPLFIGYQLISPSLLQQMRKGKKSTTNVCALYQRDIFPLRVKVASAEEQQQIVQEIESRLSVCDKIEETITNSLKQAEALRQSILKKAFEGKLV